MELLQSLTIDTQVSPKITVDLASGAPSGSNLLLQLVKPKFTLNTALGSRTVAPWGEPSANYWPAIQAALLISAALLAWRVLR